MAAGYRHASIKPCRHHGSWLHLRSKPCLLSSAPTCCCLQANLVKQLSKLVKVRYVEDITRTYRVGEWQHHVLPLCGRGRRCRDVCTRPCRSPGSSCVQSPIQAAAPAQLLHGQTFMLNHAAACIPAGMLVLCLVAVAVLPVLTETLSAWPPAERELMLLKLRAPAGPARTEVLQLAEIFRARVVDVSERCLTLCVSGDPGKVSNRPPACVCL